MNFAKWKIAHRPLGDLRTGEIAFFRTEDPDDKAFLRTLRWQYIWTLRDGELSPGLNPKDPEEAQDVRHCVCATAFEGNEWAAEKFFVKFEEEEKAATTDSNNLTGEEAMVVMEVALTVLRDADMSAAIGEAMDLSDDYLSTISKKLGNTMKVCSDVTGIKTGKYRKNN